MKIIDQRPHIPTPLRYLGMTQLPRDLEERLVFVSHERLVRFLHTKTDVSDTDTIYTAVQMIAKTFTLKEINSFLTLQDRK